MRRGVHGTMTRPTDEGRTDGTGPPAELGGNASDPSGAGMVQGQRCASELARLCAHLANFHAEPRVLNARGQSIGARTHGLGAQPLAAMACPKGSTGASTSINSVASSALAAGDTAPCAMEAFALVRWQSKLRTREHQSTERDSIITPIHMEKPRSRLIADQAHDLHGHDHDAAPLHRPQALYPPQVASPSQAAFEWQDRIWHFH